MSLSEIDARPMTLPTERRYPAENFITYFKWYLLQVGVAVLVAAYAFGRAQLQPGSNLWVLGSIAATVGGALVLSVVYRQVRRTRWVELSPTALTWEDSTGVHECSLSEIREVYRSETVTTYNHLWAHHQLKVTVTMTEERTLMLDLGIAGVNELCELLEQIAGAYRSDRPDGGAAESGERFGPLTVFPDGLLMKGRKYPWDDIRSYEIDNGYLRINPYMKKGCKPAEFALSKIPNYSYLLELMEARTGRPLMEA